MSLCMHVRMYACVALHVCMRLAMMLDDTSPRYVNDLARVANGLPTCLLACLLVPNKQDGTPYRDIWGM